MRVFITGGSGLIGRRLASSLREDGHQPVVLSRRSDELRRSPEMWADQIVQGDPTTPGPWQDVVDGCDAVVNLAGENIFATRWNAAVKARIRDSRVYSTEQLVAAMRRAHARPKVFVQASAIGYYGSRGDEELTESGPSGSDFLAVVCRENEEAGEPVEALGVRRVAARIGIVLAAEEGALKRMVRIFKLGPGAPVGGGGQFWGEGRQWMSWAHIDDVVGILRLALENPEASGPINATSPGPVRNAEFARVLSDVLRSRATPWRRFVPVGPPDAFLHLMLGEVASVITTGQKVLPAKAQALGYAFRHPDLEGALRAILASKPAPVHAAAASAPPASKAATAGHHH